MTLDGKRARYLESDGGKNRDKGIEPFIFHSFIYVSPFVSELRFYKTLKTIFVVAGGTLWLVSFNIKLFSPLTGT